MLVHLIEEEKRDKVTSACGQVWNPPFINPNCVTNYKSECTCGECFKNTRIVDKLRDIFTEDQYRRIVELIQKAPTRSEGKKRLKTVIDKIEETLRNSN